MEREKKREMESSQTAEGGHGASQHPPSRKIYIHISANALSEGIYIYMYIYVGANIYIHMHIYTYNCV